MRKAEKEQAEKLIGLLGQVQEGIRKKLEMGRREEALDLLGQCQDAAIQLGEAIEQSEGEGFVTVTLLEEYCEIVYQIYEAIRQGEPVHAFKAHKNLNRSLISIENSVKNHIRVRKEIVFLPYKASMWDSLESVWRAAEEDPDCDAYVIPIPYFDKKPDGSLGKMHDESKEYPEYVPVLDWKNYNLKTWRPDMIYIHNPYDNYNIVTSVHPDFYAERLYQCTDLLVYIPYFIHQNDVVKDHYCVLPGTIFADRVVLQSEKVRKQYMEEFGKALGANSRPEQIEKKFVAYGSPKFDLQNQDVCEEELPEDWKKVIFEDGERKPVVFFNTHLTMLMQPYSDAFFRKLRHVFDIFRKDRSLVILWRPHPLSEATAKSMNPEAAQAYQELVQEYQREHIGIYDVSPDLHRAINVSDAYYGSRSSVIELFKAAGKPVMVMDHRI